MEQPYTPRLSGALLIADRDDRSARETAAALAHYGLTVSLAGTTDEVMAAATSSAVDAILVNTATLPRDLGRRLRERGFAGPVLAVTEREPAAAPTPVGFDGSVYCDVRPPRLYALLAAHLRRSEPAEPGSLAANPGYRDLVDKYVSGFHSLSAELTAAHDRGDREAVRGMAHRLAIASLYGFDDISEVARAVERLVKAEREAAEVLDHLAELLIAHSEAAGGAATPSDGGTTLSRAAAEKLGGASGH